MHEDPSKHIPIPILAVGANLVQNEMYVLGRISYECMSGDPPPSSFIMVKKSSIFWKSSEVIDVSRGAFSSSEYVASMRILLALDNY